MTRPRGTDGARVKNMTEHDGCKLCKYENCSIESKECIGCKQNAVDKYTRMTNADRIRSFMDEELAEYLLKSCENPMMEVNEGICDFCNIYEEDKSCNDDCCKNAILKWLQSDIE